MYKRAGLEPIKLAKSVFLLKLQFQPRSSLTMAPGKTTSPFPPTNHPSIPRPQKLSKLSEHP
ncbi:hypothetical protein IG631_11920 [Alternaria alternata]|nr:hypothetical protein IG631_11920 [Alternaria alternata]